MPLVSLTYINRERNLRLQSQPLSLSDHLYGPLSRFSPIALGKHIEVLPATGAAMPDAAFHGVSSVSNFLLPVSVR